MRTHSINLLFVCSVAALQSSIIAAPISTSFTYQGQLKESGVPLNGSVDLRFRLWDAASSGNSVAGPLEIPNVSVTDGLFTAPVDFGAAVFDGNDRWLEIAVRSPAWNGNGVAPAFVPLTTRQKLSGIPYALQTRGIFVNSNASFVGIGRNSPITTAEVFGLRRTGTGFGGMYVDTSDAAGQPFYGYATNGAGRSFHYLDSTGGWRLSLGGTDRLTLTSAGNLGLGVTSPEGRLHVLKGLAGSVTADANSVLVLENGTNAYLSLLTPDANERGILFGEPSNNVSGGIIYNSAGTLDGLQFRTNGNVVRAAIASNGNFGIGTTDPQSPLDVSLDGGAKHLQIRYDGGLVPGINVTGTGGNLGILRIRNAIELWPNDAGSSAAYMDLRNTTGTPMIGLDGGSGNIVANGSIQVDGLGANAGNTDVGVLRFGAGNSGEAIASNRSGAGSLFGLDFYTAYNVRMSISNGGNVGIGTTNPAAKLDVAGRTRTNSLEIVGGADLAEPVDVEGDVQPGMVLVIDAEHPGRFKVASVRYDRKAAGIVSGANGVGEGLLMRVDGSDAVDGKYPLAMAGRVWCWCDASNDPITPGDLLTTSATRGHAMRVTDDAQAPRGSIIGKAMTPLGSGTGLVLVLVNLQ